jgi:hypothetical protein
MKAGLEIGKFSAAMPGGNFPPGWQPLTFKKIIKHTSYSLVEDGGSAVVKSSSESSASGMIKHVTIDPKEYPIIKWRWKIMNIIEKGDVTQKTGDDYAARIYITFRYEPQNLGFFEKAKYKAARLLYGHDLPAKAINYIWANKAPVGTIVPNPYTGQSKMIVIQSGKDRLNHWVDEIRNVNEDYKTVFGHSPPALSGVAIMTDSDNTKESATAYYGDILFMKKIN